VSRKRPISGRTEQALNQGSTSATDTNLTQTECITQMSERVGEAEVEVV
jgi:hypothetical protein